MTFFKNIFSAVIFLVVLMLVFIFSQGASKELSRLQE